MTDGLRKRRRGGFTLIELLVVVLIVILVSAVTLPTIISALGNRHVSEAARILQAALAGARDAAIRANAPRGIRLLPDSTLSSFDATTAGRTNRQPSTLTASRIVSIEPAVDITDGAVTFANLFFATWTTPGNLPPQFPFPVGLSLNPAAKGYYPYFLPTNVPNPLPLLPNQSTPYQVLLVEQAVYINNNTTLGFNPPTNWFWNVRIGDRFRLGNAGHSNADEAGQFFTVVGPMTIPNPENLVNDGPPGMSTLSDRTVDVTTGNNVTPEFLFLVNGKDDDNDGYIDNGVDGVNQNQDVDANQNGLPRVDDLQEWTEVETGFETQARLFVTRPSMTWTYAISRRPVPTPGSREVSLPAGAVVDMTTWDTTRERSRLPVDLNNGYVDIMLNQAGQVIPTTEYSSPSSATIDQSFYHFWIADRADVFEPLYDSQNNPGSNPPLLPLPQPGFTEPFAATDPNHRYPPTYNPGLAGKYLKKDRHLVTLFARTGLVVTNPVEDFDYSVSPDPNRPFYNAQLGTRGEK